MQAEAVGLLALVAGQDVEPGDHDGTWRIAPVTRPDRIVSVNDAESRHVHKTTSNYRDGFKAHIGVEPDTGLITACELTAGNVGDAQAAPGLLAGESSPVEVLADSAYGSGEFRAHLAERGHTATIKPIPLKPVVPEGFSVDDFIIDLTARTATCPNGITSRISTPVTPPLAPSVVAARCGTLHHRPRRTHRHDQPASRSARRRPRPRAHACLHRALPPAPADGRTLHRLARPTRRPQSPLPRHRPQPHRTRAPCAAINMRRLINLGLGWNNGWTAAT